MAEEVYSLLIHKYITIQKYDIVDIDALEIPDSSIYDIEYLKWISHQDEIAYSLTLNSIKIGFALIKKINENCNKLLCFEIFHEYQKEGYGTLFAKFIIQKYDIHLDPINGSRRWWMKLGAVPIYVYGGGFIFCISRVDSDEYLKLLTSDNISHIYDKLSELDNRIYDKKRNPGTLNK